MGAATLSLLAAYAEQGPLAILLDDAHWLDDSSAQALLFAFRRLFADPIGVLITARDDEPSLLDGADLPTLRLDGLSGDESVALLPELAPELSGRLHEATGGNPLGLIELAQEADQLELAPAGAPVLLPGKIARAFLRRAEGLEAPTRRALVLAATSDSRDLATIERAARKLGLDIAALAPRAGCGTDPDPGRRARLPPSARPLRHLRAGAGRAAAARRIERWRTRCRTVTSTAGPGISRPPPRARTSPPRPRSPRPAPAAGTGAPMPRPPRRSNARRS